MKKNWKAFLLAAAVGLCALAVPVFAEQAGTVEALTEAEAAASDAAQTPETEDPMATFLEESKARVAKLISDLSAMPDEQIQNQIDYTEDADYKAMLASWKNVKKELGSFVSINSQEAVLDGDVIRVVSDVTYDQMAKGSVATVTFEQNLVKNDFSMNWDVQYPVGKLFV